MALLIKIGIHETGEIFSGKRALENELHIGHSLLEHYLYGHKQWNGLTFYVIRDENKKCIKCGIPLTKSNWYEHCQKDNWRICKKCVNKITAKNTKRLKEKNPFRYKSYDLKWIYGENIDSNDLKNIWKKQQGKCAICNSELNKNSFHIDHIIPISKKGTTKIDNLQFLCEKCNRGKFNWTQKEYIEHCKTVAKNK